LISTDPDVTINPDPSNVWGAISAVDAIPEVIAKPYGRFGFNVSSRDP